MDQDTPREDQGTDPGTWVTIAEAARRLGVTPKAIRNRVQHNSLRWRQRGNFGREVLIPEGIEPEDSPGDNPRTFELMVQVARLEERLAANNARVKTEMEAVRQQLETEVAARNAVIKELKAGLDHERARADRLEAALAEARKGWLERLLETLRRR